MCASSSIQSIYLLPLQPYLPFRIICRRRSARLFPMDTNKNTFNSRHPKRLVFAPGDITEHDAEIGETLNAKPTTLADINPDKTSCIGSATERDVLSHAARAHQFVVNPPLTVSQLDLTNPLQQFHAWFRDPRLTPSSSPETCTLATASLPSGRVSARMVYFKELDERGWVIYSNWGSREGKGGQVFGDEQYFGYTTTNSSEANKINAGQRGTTEICQANRWAALTFFWQCVERQVRIEGLIEPLSKEESEIYWRTRERGSQIGGWASWQSKVLWSVEPETLPPRYQPARQSLSQSDKICSGVTAAELPNVAEALEIDDGRSVLEQQVKDMVARFEDIDEIPLPPFWGGVRIVPESVEFWQGQHSRLHDRFRYERVHAIGNGLDERESFKWRIERLSP